MDQCFTLFLLCLQSRNLFETQHVNFLKIPGIEVTCSNLNHIVYFLLLDKVVFIYQMVSKVVDDHWGDL